MAGSRKGIARRGDVAAVDAASSDPQQDGVHDPIVGEVETPSSSNIDGHRRFTEFSPSRGDRAHPRKKFEIDSMALKARRCDGNPEASIPMSTDRFRGRWSHRRRLLGAVATAGQGGKVRGP